MTEGGKEGKKRRRKKRRKKNWRKGEIWWLKNIEKEMMKENK